MVVRRELCSMNDIMKSNLFWDQWSGLLIETLCNPVSLTSQKVCNKKPKLWCLCDSVGPGDCTNEPFLRSFNFNVEQVEQTAHKTTFTLWGKLLISESQLLLASCSELFPRVPRALMAAPQAEQIDNHFTLRGEFSPHGVCPSHKPTLHRGRETTRVSLPIPTSPSPPLRSAACGHQHQAGNLTFLTAFIFS